MTTYESIRPRLKTGDIVLFSGNGGISKGIKLFTRSKWSHVGMVLEISEIETIMLWESTTLNNIKDIESGVERKGVQIVPLSERLRKYDGDAAVRLLDVEITSDMLKALNELRAEVKGRKYETSEMELVRAAYDGPFGKNTEDLSSLFCSELVAEAYQRMGLLDEAPPGLPSNEYIPKDFSEKAGLTLKKGTLGPEIMIEK